jgi:GNAT superfamily N-acetyltransferase
MLEYQVMEPSEWKACALLAAEAFYDYAYFSIYVPDDERRKRFLRALIQCEFKANRNLEAVTFFTAKESGKTVAVAQLCSPEFKKPDDMTYVRSGWFSAVFKGGSKGVNAWNAMEKVASAPCHQLPGKNWYLSLLTVAPDSERKGIGSRFLNECIIPFVKGRGAEILSLFTNSEENRKFYVKNGFSEFDEKHFTYEGKTIGSWSYIMRF